MANTTFQVSSIEKYATLHEFLINSLHKDVIISDRLLRNYWSGHFYSGCCPSRRTNRHRSSRFRWRRKLNDLVRCAYESVTLLMNSMRDPKGIYYIFAIMLTILCLKISVESNTAEVLTALVSYWSYNIKNNPGKLTSALQGTTMTGPAKLLRSRDYAGTRTTSHDGPSKYPSKYNINIQNYFRYE